MQWLHLFPAVQNQRKKSLESPSVSENKVLCHPSSVDSLSTSAATEDHVSMGGWAARKALRVIEHVEQGEAQYANVFFYLRKEGKNANKDEYKC